MQSPPDKPTADPKPAPAGHAPNPGDPPAGSERETGRVEGRSYGQIVARAFRRNRPAMVAACGVLALFTIAGLAPLLANSLPYTVVVDGERRWPLFHALTGTERVGLAAVAVGWVALVVTGWRRRKTGPRAGLVRGAAKVAVPAWIGLSVMLVLLPQGRPLASSEIDALTAAGRATDGRYAPVPFSYDSTAEGHSHSPPGFGSAYRIDVRTVAALKTDGVPDAAAEAIRSLAGRRYDTADELRADVERVAGAGAWAKWSDRYLNRCSTHGHVLGTDGSGGDVLSRLIHGARTSLAVGFVAVSVSTTIGILMGATMGWFGGRVDMVLMRLMEIVMSIPTLFLVITISGLLPSRSLFTVMAVIGLTTWPLSARFVRAEFLRLRKQDFVSASRALGAGDLRIMLLVMLPNALAPVLVEATFGVGSAIFLEASLNFLGMGAGPDVPSWGGMLGQLLQRPSSWWLSVFPGAAIFATVLCYNLVGEGLRDAGDPRLGKAAS